MDIPNPTRKFQLYLEPVYMSPHVQRVRLPLVGQYVYNLTVNIRGYWLPNYTVTLELDDIFGNLVDIAKLYSDGVSRSCMFDFFRSPLPLITESLYKTGGAYARIEFLDGVPSDYTVSCMVGFVDENYTKESLRTRQIPTLTTNGHLLNYYDGILWIS